MFTYTFLNKRCLLSMVLNTKYPTWVYDDYLVDPSIMDKLSKKTTQKRNVEFYDYSETNHDCEFVKISLLVFSK